MLFYFLLAAVGQPNSQTSNSFRNPEKLSMFALWPCRHARQHWAPRAVLSALFYTNTAETIASRFSCIAAAAAVQIVHRSSDVAKWIDLDQMSARVDTILWTWACRVSGRFGVCVRAAYVIQSKECRTRSHRVCLFGWEKNGDLDFYLCIVWNIECTQRRSSYNLHSTRTILFSFFVLQCNSFFLWLSVAAAAAPLSTQFASTFSFVSFSPNFFFLIFGLVRVALRKWKYSRPSTFAFASRSAVAMRRLNWIFDLVRSSYCRRDERNKGENLRVHRTSMQLKHK